MEDSAPAKKKARLSPAKRAAMKRKLQLGLSGEEPAAAAPFQRDESKSAKADLAAQPNQQRCIAVNKAERNSKPSHGSSPAHPSPSTSQALPRDPAALKGSNKVRSALTAPPVPSDKSSQPTRMADEASAKTGSGEHAAANARNLGWKANVGPCNVCGEMGHLGRTCPSRECRHCGGVGHIAKHCPKKIGSGSESMPARLTASAAKDDAPRVDQPQLVVPAVSAASIGIDSCTHCGSKDHVANTCTYGWQAGEEYLFCGSPGCFTRHFILPLRLGRTDFNENEPRDGRMDVATSCLSAAISRSQSLRGNAMMTLCFKEQSVRMEVRGCCIRRLQPDDLSIARQIKYAIQPMDASDGVAYGSNGDPHGERHGATVVGDEGARIVDASRYSASDRRGFVRRAGTVQDSLREALQGREGKMAVLMLHARGQHIDDVCPRLAEIVGSAGIDPAPSGRFAPTKAPANAGGVVVVLGDDRGLMPEDEAMVARVAAEFDAPVIPVSLGPVVLFASHSIVLLNHYLDKLVHACAIRPPRDLLHKKKGAANEKKIGGLSYNQPLIDSPQQIATHSSSTNSNKGRARFKERVGKKQTKVL